MRKWEYKISSVNEYDADEKPRQSVAERVLDGASKEGWELVSVITAQNTAVIFYFKREIIEVKMRPSEDVYRGINL